MKRKLISISLAVLAFACQKDEEVSIAPTKKLLTAEEQRVSASIGSVISFKDAKEQMEEYQKTSSDEIRGVAFGKDVIEKLMNKKGVVGLRFYFAKDKNGKNSLVFTGIDKDGRDITTIANARTTDSEVAGGEALPCPGFCNP
ncbi:hypothetical protein [Runella zeae]|jgi:arginyl-tRNA synthetase|uniref:hypothetical protein n=1 Tax=Runella zeae TaxID=94255 RepID=UPI002356BAA2|nr:hypothetical protein [Runella zeae]